MDSESHSKGKKHNKSKREKLRAKKAATINDVMVFGFGLHDEKLNY